MRAFGQRQELLRTEESTASAGMQKKRGRVEASHLILHLQRTAGNQAVRRLLQTTTPKALQRKLNVGNPSDIREQEADRVADEVMRMPETRAGVGVSAQSERVAVSGASSSPVIARKGPQLIPVVTGEIIEGFLEIIEEEEEKKQKPDAPQTGPWASDYKKQKSYLGESYKTYKDSIGNIKERPAIKAASEWGAQTQKRVKTEISTGQLTRIIAAAGEATTTARIAPMAGGISKAFETMRIDTAQAQAAYLAHMAGETGGVLEEIEGEKRDYAPFQGRGPVQVTHEYNYVQTLAYMESRADQLSKEVAEKEKSLAELQSKTPAPDAEMTKLNDEITKARTQVTELRVAHTAIKGDQTKAADPAYAFLFSAAYMHMTRGVRASANLGQTASFTGKGAEDSWVTGGNAQQMPDGKTKKSMTFEERRLFAVEHKRERLRKDMESAIERGQKKSKVYAKAVSVLGTENVI